MSRKYTKIDQYEKQILSILIVRAKPEQKVYLQRLRKIFLQLFTFAHPVVFIGRDRISIRSLYQGTSTQGFARLQGHPSHLLGPLGGSIRQQQFSLPRTQPFFRFFQKKQCRQSAGREAWQRIPSIVTVRTFFIGKPSFDGFGKFSPKTKKRVPLSVPREQRVNALCMEKSVLHGFGQECGKQIYTNYLVFTWIYRKAATNFSREPENRVQKVLYGASLAGNLILLAETENSANGISWLILVIDSK